MREAPSGCGALLLDVLFRRCNTWVEVDATTTVTYVQTPIVAMPADTFFRDNAN